MDAHRIANSEYVLYPNLSLLRIWHAENKSVIFQTLVGRRLAINDQQTFSLPATRKTPPEKVGARPSLGSDQSNLLSLFFSVTFKAFLDRHRWPHILPKGHSQLTDISRVENFYPELFWQTENSVIDSMTTDFSPKDISAFGFFRHFCPFAKLAFRQNIFEP